MNKQSDANPAFRANLAHGRSPGRSRSRSYPSDQARGNRSVPSSGRGALEFGAADLLPFVTALGRGWKGLLLGVVGMAMAGLLCSLSFLKTSYTASAQLLRQTSTHVMEVLGDRELEPNTYASLLRAPELMQRVAAQARPPLSAESLGRKLQITPERNSDVLLVAISTADPQSAVDLANLYAREAVTFTQALQTNAAARLSLFISQQLAPVEDEITALDKAPAPAPTRAELFAPSPMLDKLPAARLELAELLARYTERHPLVREQRAKIAALGNQLSQMPAAPAAAGEGSDRAGPEPLTQGHDPAFVHTKLQSLENARLTLLGQKQAALAVETHPPGTCQILAPATAKEVLSHKRTAKVAVLTGVAGVLGFLIAGALILLGEALDPRLKTAADVQRVTRLPVVASAADLARLSEAEQRNWAFRAWTSLQHLLSPSPNQGFVCGITSSEHGEGRSTWMRLLADAASQRGFRVLTIIALPPEHNGKAIAQTGLVANATSDCEALVPANGNGAMVVSRVLSTPDEVTQKLIGPNPEPVVQIPLPGWVWNLERRQQWHAALRHWSQIDKIALLIELPPASMPETVLLAENLPNLIWLADAQKATAAKTCEQLKTLREARCHLAGAVVNRVQVSFFRDRFARWLG